MTPGAAPVSGGGVLPGGGLSGPLIPQAAIESPAALTMKAIRQRRNIARDALRRTNARKSITLERSAPLNDSEFVALTDRVLGAIGAAIDASEEELDWSENDGVLTIECADGSRIIVNRHLLNREMWVAARSGGFHFRGDSAGWHDTRSGEELAASLRRLLVEQADATIDFGVLP